LKTISFKPPKKNSAPFPQGKEQCGKSRDDKGTLNFGVIQVV